MLGISRVPYAAAAQGRFFRVFARLHPDGFPSWSVRFIGLTSALLSLLGLDALIRIVTVSWVVVGSLAVAGAPVALRAARPDIRRPFRMFLYPVPVLIALAGWMFIVLTSGVEYILISLLLLAGGVGAYLWRAKRLAEWPFEGPPEGGHYSESTDMSMINVAKAVGAATVVTVVAMGCSKPESLSLRATSPVRSPGPAVDPYRADVEKFRQEREAKLTSDTGWLTIAGLHFLTKPETTFGSDAANDVVLPAGAPANVGTFVLAKNGKVSVKLEPGVTVSLLDGKPFAGGPDQIRRRRAARSPRVRRRPGVDPPERRASGRSHPRQEQPAAQGVHRHEVVPGE